MRPTVAAVLDEAERHLDEFDPETSGAWPHAAAALIRQSLESTLDFFWRGKEPAMLEACARDRWVCLPFLIGDRPEARAAYFAWSALSEACHHRRYDVGLTQGELREHLTVARAFATLVAGASARARPAAR